MTFCDILPGRSFGQAASLLGADYDGWLTHRRDRDIKAASRTCFAAAVRWPRCLRRQPPASRSESKNIQVGAPFEMVRPDSRRLARGLLLDCGEAVKINNGKQAGCCDMFAVAIAMASTHPHMPLQRKGTSPQRAASGGGSTRLPYLPDGNYLRLSYFSECVLRSADVPVHDVQSDRERGVCALDPAEVPHKLNSRAASNNKPASRAHRRRRPRPAAGASR